jgi:hypothetical protein
VLGLPQGFHDRPLARSLPCLDSLSWSARDLDCIAKKFNESNARFSDADTAKARAGKEIWKRVKRVSIDSQAI